MTHRTRILATVASAALALAVAVAAYVFRDRLPTVPYAGGVFRPAASVDDRDRILYWTCPMHPDVRAAESGKHDIPDCGMDLVPVRANNAAVPSGPSPSAAPPSTPATVDRAEVRLDPRRQQLMGVRTLRVARVPLTPVIRAVGVVRYNETRQTDVNMKLEGWIRDLHVNYTGQAVTKGQPLFTFYSPDLVTTENEYLLALKTRDSLQQSQIADARERANELVRSARQRLAFWDLPDADISALETTRQAQTAVTFRSPATGVVVEKVAVNGMHMTPGQTLYKLADLSTVWIEADVYEGEAPLVRIGSRATITVDAYPKDRFTGRAIYVYPFVDEKTRTNKVRYEFANRDGRLKPGMFANVELTIAEGPAIVVPTNAVLDAGSDQVVFVAKGDGVFEPRHVKVGRRFSNEVQILEGIKEGEEVATGAAFFLDSESQLRAGLQGYEPSPAIQPSASGAQQVDVIFQSIPDPPKTGEDQFEVSLKDLSGKPIENADVTVQFFMPAMPTMNMPAMRQDTKLSAAGGGVYRGRGQVTVGGRWEVTVTVTRNGQRLAEKRLTVVAQ
jgi:RND family efflux transporter MFP subunit